MEQKPGANTSQSYTYSGLSDGKTYYLRVIVEDKAGHQGKSAGDGETGTSATTPVANTPPYNLTTDLSSRTTNSLTVRARAYDNDSPAQTLTYTLSLNGQTRTATGTSGNYVTFSAVSGLSQYTYYDWTVTVTDSKSNPISATGRDRTYCSGTGANCKVSDKNCTICNGTGFLCSGCGAKFYGPMTDSYMSCGGSHFWYGHGWTCNTCVAFAIRPDEFLCPTCGRYPSSGSYLRLKPCTTCDGDGLIPGTCSHGLSAGVVHCVHGQRFQH